LVTYAPNSVPACTPIDIATAVVTEFREGGTVISAMFTGRKVHEERPVDLEP